MSRTTQSSWGPLMVSGKTSEFVVATNASQSDAPMPLSCPALQWNCRYTGHSARPDPYDNRRTMAKHQSNGFPKQMIPCSLRRKANTFMRVLRALPNRTELAMMGAPKILAIGISLPGHKRVCHMLCIQTLTHIQQQT